jgi:DNA-directed RNA polymerase subunit E'/Rpb7
MDIDSPSKQIIQSVRIMIQPHMMNSDIKDNMLLVLRQKVEGKCNKYGFIQTVHYIKTYTEGIILPENFSGSATYNIEYVCTSIIPIENTIIIGNIAAINPELVLVKNGPILIFIPKANIDTNIWDASNDFTDKINNTVLKQNDSVKVHIDKIKINQNELQIKCIGRLMERATDEEVIKFCGPKTESNFIM